MLVDAGLASTVAAETEISSVDGNAGELIIRGYALAELAGRATYEEAAFLVLNGDLPTRAELRAFSKALGAWATLPPPLVDLLRSAAAAQAAPMDCLRLGVDALSLSAPDAIAETEVMLLARIPLIAATVWRLLGKQPLLAAEPQLTIAGNFLYLLHGAVPHPAHVRALDTYLTTVIDHGMNASTFTARVVTSTGANPVPAITAAIGALQGPLHGGAPGPALDMVLAIGSKEAAEPALRAQLARGERLMGFGHRVYRVRDPRADVLALEAERLFRTAGDMGLYDLARHVERTAVALLAEHRPGRALETNVEFYTALLLHGLGLTPAMFSPTFAVGRTAGWLAHCREQRAAARIIRPRSAYVGAAGRTWQALDARKTPAVAGV